MAPLTYNGFRSAEGFIAALHVPEHPTPAPGLAGGRGWTRPVACAPARPPVNGLIADLAAWHQSYQRLQDARTRLQEAGDSGADAEVLRPLEQEVELLRQRSDACLDRLKASAVARH